jgi:SAM-dependent methyltransferase
MTTYFERIKRIYGESFRDHGDSPAALLTPKGRNELRFRAIDPFVREPGVRVLDYGCGLGYLFEYLVRNGFDVAYTGLDILPEFVSACRNKYGGAAEFVVTDALAPVKGHYDIVFCSGVFNIRTDDNLAVSKKYAFEKIQQLFNVTSDVLICDFMSSLVDFQQPESQHFSPGEIAEFSASRLSRRFQIRHDLLPYECTLVVWRNAAIKRPENFYEVDS